MPSLIPFNTTLEYTADNCCSMAEVANQGLQLTLRGHPLAAPGQHQCSCARELVGGKAEFHSNGVNLDAKKSERGGGAFSLMHGHSNTQTFADLKCSQESLLALWTTWWANKKKIIQVMELALDALLSQHPGQGVGKCQEYFWG